MNVKFHKAARAAENRQAEGMHLGNLGLAHADPCDAHKAIEYYEQALVITRETGDRDLETTLLHALEDASGKSRI